MTILPKPIALSSGSSISLTDLLNYEFGSAASSIGYVYLFDRSASYLKTNDFNYWDPASPINNNWTVNGTSIATDVNSAKYTASSFSNIYFNRGNSISTFETVSIGGNWHVLNVVDPSLMSDTALQGNHAPTPQDIIDTAYKFNQKYGAVSNDNDCHQIAREVAAAAGAALPSVSASLTPSDNQEQGFWRIAYRGTDPNAVSNWQDLVQPGDIVRLGWTNGNPHTTTVLSVDSVNRTLTVYDNTYYVDGVEKIGIHTRNFDQKTLSADITIYRLTTDDTYLVSGTTASETLLGSDYNDTFSPLQGNDTINGGGGTNTVVYKSTNYASALISKD
jgi:hypothetical protein